MKKLLMNEFPGFCQMLNTLSYIGENDAAVYLFGLYDKYDQYDSSKLSFSPSDMLASTLIWDETEQGFEYWNALDDILRTAMMGEVFIKKAEADGLEINDENVNDLMKDNFPYASDEVIKKALDIIHWNTCS